MCCKGLSKKSMDCFSKKKKEISGPITRSSAYANDEIGACGATGNDIIMMRFLPWQRK